MELYQVVLIVIASMALGAGIFGCIIEWLGIKTQSSKIEELECLMFTELIKLTDINISAKRAKNIGKLALDTALNAEKLIEELRQEIKELKK